MRKRYKIGLIIISVLLASVIGVGVFKIFYSNDEEEKEPNVTNVISNIQLI